MAGIKVSGVGSGLDIQGLISQLMTFERRPLNVLKEKKSSFEAQISAVGRLGSALSSFNSSMEKLKSMDSFKVYTATSSNESELKVSANSIAEKGTYQIEVTSLAKAHKIGTANGSFSSTDTVGNAGDRMNITINGESVSLEIGGKTLAQIRTEINSLSDNPGLTASLVTASDSNHNLILTADKTGVDFAIQTEYTDSGGNPIADPFGFNELQGASDATFVIDNTYTSSRSTNEASDIIPGVKLTAATLTSSPVTVNVGRDPAAITQSVNDFVAAYNLMQSSLKIARGNLKGDNTVLNIETRLRGILNTAPTGLTGSFTALSQVGISLDKTGTMKLDSSTLESALDRDFDGFAQLMANDSQGFVNRLSAEIDGLMDTKGLIDGRRTGLRARVSALDQQISLTEYRMEQVERRYLRQFTSLDSVLSQMQSTSGYLQQQLSTLPGFSGSN
jgi:flagellar hook-associated protein 2